MKKIIIGSALCLCALNANATPTYSMQQIPLISTSINNNGLVVGREYLNNTFDAAVWNSNTGAITLLPSLPNTSSVYAIDINDSGQVIGQIFSSSGINAVMWENNKLTVLNDLAGGYSRPNDINNLGQVLGVSGDSRLLSLWNDGKNPVEIGEYPDAFQTFFNDAGQIAWTKPVDPNVWELGRHAFFRDNGVDHDLGTLGGKYSYANALNENGLIAGDSGTSIGGNRSFVWDGDSMHTLAMLPGFGGGWTHASSINNHNVVVGYQNSPDSDLNHAILWNGWQALDIKDLLADQYQQDGWIITDAIDINDFGQIVAYAFNDKTQQGGYYLLTPDSQVSPIPEPSTYAMMLAGLGLLGFVGGRKAVS